MSRRGARRSGGGRRIVALGLVGLLALACAGEAGAALDRGPYLHQTTATSTIIVWRTGDDSTGEVRFGTDPDLLGAAISSGVVARQHEVKLSGLAPSTRYYYAVISDGAVVAGGDADHYVDTAPATGERAKIRAWVLGDSGTGGQNQANVRDAMLAHVGRARPSLLLHMGDMAYSNGTNAEFTDKFFAPYRDILRSTTVWPALGNHEGSSADSATQSGPYYTAYVLPSAGEAGGLASGTEAYYSFDYGNVHFIVLDSHESPREPDGAMLQWMAIDLATTSQEWVIAYWHHPPYTKGTHDSDVETAHVEMRENALPILEAGGVDLVLGGHSHIYERSYLVDGGYETPTTDAGILSMIDGRPDGDGPYVKPPGGLGHLGALYVVAGHGGASVGALPQHPLMYFAEAQHGSCILDVHQNRLTLINIRDDGEVSDHVTLIKGQGIEIFAPNGGELLTVGGVAEIGWATVGPIAEVSLDYSIDDGETWMPIAADVPNTGAYAWLVPPVNTDMGLVRVSAAADASIYDESNASFAVEGGIELDAIKLGSAWWYHDQGVDLGDAWRMPGYDFTGWPSGPAQLGYGEGDEATALVDADPNHPSAYFLRTFEVDQEIVGATLELVHDDGAAVWINGQLVASVNADDLAYGAWASAQSDDNAVAIFDLELAPNPIVLGTNVIGVMVKQVSEDSSDLSFDLGLTLIAPAHPPETGGESEGGSSGSTAGSGGGEPTTGGSSGASSATGPGSDADGGSCACRSGEGGGWLEAGLLLLLAAGRRRGDG